jgi:hypothetical protein
MNVKAMAIDDPDTVREVRAQFDAYEAAFMRHDVQALNACFRADPATTRYGITDLQLGHAEIAAFRAASAPPDFERRLENVRITTFGTAFAVAQTEFVRSDTAKRGFQTQAWVRLPEGWRIVAAHVSMIDLP